MLSVRIALGLAATLLAVVLGVTLVHSPPSVARANGIPAEAEVAGTREGSEACQAREIVPAGTTALRLAIAAEIGPAVSVVAKSGGRVVTHGARAAGWTGANVTVPVVRVSHASEDAEICFTLGRPIEAVKIVGAHVPAAEGLVADDGERLGGRIRVEYLSPGRASWLSLAPSIARRMGFGHAWSGTWIVFALLAAMASVTFLLARVAVRELR